MTDREKAIVMAHTGICMLAGEKLDVFYQYLAELYGRPVYTHEWLTLDIKEKSKPDFIKLCEEEQPERKNGYRDGYKRGKRAGYKKGRNAGRKTGQWIVYKAPDDYHCGLVKCPFCGEDLIAEADEYNYCPGCGAHLREEGGE